MPAYLDPISCPCNSFHEEATGGISAAGLATVTDSIIRIEGGVRCGGSALISMPSQTTGIAAHYPLDGSYDGTTGEVLDLSGFGLHGTAGSGDSEYATDQDDGVFCLFSQAASDRMHVEVPADSLTTTQGFSVSLWVKRTGYHEDRILFSRGIETANTDWVFTLGHSALGHLYAQIQTYDEDDALQLDMAYSTTLLAEHRWYHVAANWKPGEALEVYINGILEGSTGIPNFVTPANTNGGYIGGWNSARGWTGNLQEVRLYGEAKNAAWFLAEYENFCSSGWYFVSPIESFAPAKIFDENASGGVVADGEADEEYVEAPSTITLSSTFDTGFDGWTSSYWEYAGSGGQSGGYVRSRQADLNQTKTLTRTVEIASGGGTISFHYQRQGEFIPGYTYYPRLSSNIDGTLWSTTGNPNSWTSVGPLSLSEGTHNLNFNCGYQDSASWKIGIDSITITNVVA